MSDSGGRAVGVCPGCGAECVVGPRGGLYCSTACGNRDRNRRRRALAVKRRYASGWRPRNVQHDGGVGVCSAGCPACQYEREEIARLGEVPPIRLNGTRKLPGGSR